MKDEYVLYKKVNEYYTDEYEIKGNQTFVSHDGHDRYGPKSNLYDYLVWYKKDNKYFIDIWHTEQWYTKYEKIQYELYDTYECTREQFHKELEPHMSTSEMYRFLHTLDKIHRDDYY
jgi:hypothetical protein